MAINLGVISDDLTFMYEQVKKFNGKAGGKLEVKDMMWYIKAWTKLGEMLSGGGYRKITCFSYIRKGEPDKTTMTRMKVLQRDLGTFSDLVDKRLQSNDSTGLGPGTTFFDAVDKAMLNLVKDFWQQIAGQKAKEGQLLGDIQAWQGLNQEKAMEAEVFPMDRHA